MRPRALGRKRRAGQFRAEGAEPERTRAGGGEREKQKARDGRFRKVQRACPVNRQVFTGACPVGACAFTGRVQPRMERTLRAITPHFPANLTSALRSFPSFGD